MTLFGAKTRKLALEERSFKLPDGSREESVVLVGNSQVVVLPITRDRKIVLVRSFQLGAERFLWGLPSNSVRDGETFWRAAWDLLSEIGYCAEELDTLHSDSILVDPGNSEISFRPIIAWSCQEAKAPAAKKRKMRKNIWLVSPEELLGEISSGNFDLDSRTSTTAFLALKALKAKIIWSRKR